MSYTPPAYNATNFTFQGDSAYTPPAYNATNFSFVEAPLGADILLTAEASASSLGAKVARASVAVSGASQSNISTLKIPLAVAVVSGVAGNTCGSKKLAYTQSDVQALAGAAISGHISSPMVYISVSAAASCTVAGKKVSLSGVYFSGATSSTEQGVKVATWPVVLSSAAVTSIGSASKSAWGASVTEQLLSFLVDGEGVHPPAKEYWDASSCVARAWSETSSVLRDWESTSPVMRTWERKSTTRSN